MRHVHIVIPSPTFSMLSRFGTHPMHKHPLYCSNHVAKTEIMVYHVRSGSLNQCSVGLVLSHFKCTHFLHPKCLLQLSSTCCSALNSMISLINNPCAIDSPTPDPSISPCNQTLEYNVQVISWSGWWKIFGLRYHCLKNSYLGNTSQWMSEGC